VSLVADKPMPNTAKNEKTKIDPLKLDFISGEA
jgi:hypothetical protein